MKATVMKVMISDGKTLKPGDIVDVSGWRHTKNLVSNSFPRSSHASNDPEWPGISL